MRTRWNSTISPQRHPAELDTLSFYVGRLYYGYIGLLESMLRERGLRDVIAPGMGHILFALFHEDDRAIKDLSRDVWLSPSTLTGMLDRMQRAGLITRHRDPGDGRLVRIRLTPLARSLKEQCQQLAADLDRILHKQIDEDDLETLKALLFQVTRNLREAAGDKALE